jgi:hypothetical protein
MLIDKPVKFKQWDCKVMTSLYSNGHVAIRLVDAEDFSPVATATLNMAEYGYPQEKDEVYIKDYSENEGVLKALQEAEIIGEVLGEYPLSQWVNAHRCKLLV